MRVLALDIATNSGWAVDGDQVCPPRFGSYRIPGGAHNLGSAVFRFNVWLHQLAGTHKPDLIAYEAPMLAYSGQRTAQTMRVLISLCAIAESVAYAHRVRVKDVSVQTVRRHFVGHGRPENPKAVVFDRCRQLGWEVGSHDQADACAVWCWAKATYDPSFRLETGPLFAGAA